MAVTSFYSAATNAAQRELLRQQQVEAEERRCTTHLVYAKGYDREQVIQQLLYDFDCDLFGRGEVISYELQGTDLTVEFIYRMGGRAAAEATYQTIGTLISKVKSNWFGRNVRTKYYGRIRIRRLEELQRQPID